MTIFRSLSILTLAAVLPAAAAQAEPKIYPFESKENYCPAGLQPVQLDGVICCGTPNQSQSYYSMMRENAGRTRVYRASSGAICPEGEKGCYLE